MHLYPVSQAAEEASKMMQMAPSLGASLVIMALIPAICEELAFRGFILSGFRHLGHKWWAIVLTSILFGVTHTILQQSIVAGIVGMFIGYIAVQTGSIFPGMLFHFCNNAMWLIVADLQDSELFRRITIPMGDNHDFIYSWWLVGAGLLIAAPILMKFAGLNYRQTKEERLQEAIQRQAAVAGGM